jgi:hypothetical protein
MSHDKHDAYDGYLYFFAHIARKGKEIGGCVISVITVMPWLKGEARRQAESWQRGDAGGVARSLPTRAPRSRPHRDPSVTFRPGKQGYAARVQLRVQLRPFERVSLAPRILHLPRFVRSALRGKRQFSRPESASTARKPFQVSFFDEFANRHLLRRAGRRLHGFVKAYSAVRTVIDGWLVFAAGSGRGTKPLLAARAPRHTKHEKCDRQAQTEQQQENFDSGNPRQVRYCGARRHRYGRSGNKRHLQSLFKVIPNRHDLGFYPGNSLVMRHCGRYG